MAYTEAALYVGSVSHTAVTQFAISTAYTVGQIRRQLAAPAAGNERCFVCIVAGTSAGSEPSWTITKGAKTVSNTATFQECTGLPALNGDGTNTPAWAASKGAIVLGVVIKNTAATHYFICTTAGTGGTGAEPSWNTTAGVTTADGSVTWTCLGAVGSFTTGWAAVAKMLQSPVLGATWLVNAGMTIYVAHDHSESTASSYSPAVECRVLCVDRTAAVPPTASDLRTTAAISITSAQTFWSTAVNGYVYGLQITPTVTGVSVGGASALRLYLEQCAVSVTVSTASLRTILGTSSSVGGLIEFKDCTFNTGAATQSLSIRGPVRMENCTFTGSFGGSGNQIFSGENLFTSLIAEGCDLSVAVAGNLVGSGPGGVPYGYFLLKDCKGPPGGLAGAYRGGDATMTNLVIDAARCDYTGTNYYTERHTSDGTLTTSTTVVRTGGAGGGVTPVSHQIATTANTNNYARVFNSIPFAAWNAITGTNRTVTVYGLANDSRVPNDGEFWFDVEYLGSASSPDGDFKRGRALPLATASALTADTSSWDSAATARANSTAYTVGQVIKVASNSGRLFFCTVAGTSAGSEPVGYASAVDGGSVTDGTATFRAACRFRQALTLSSPQPAQAGLIYAHPKFGRASTTYYLDPMMTLS
jgi:hypothetical protein